MARRRSPGRGGGNFAAATQPLISALLQDRLMRRRQEESDARQFAARQAQFEQETGRREQEAGFNTAVQLIPDITSGRLRPGQIPPELSSRLPFDVSSMAPTQVQTSEPLFKEIQGSTLSNLPTPEGVVSRAVGLGPQEDLTNINQLMAERNRRQGILEFEDRVTNQEEIPGIDPVTLAPTTTFVPRRDLISRGPITTGMTPEQSGQAALRTARAGSLSPEMNQLEVQKQNAIEAGTRPGAVARAGQVAGAQQRAHYNAEFAPDIMDARVQQYGRMKELDAQHSRAAGTTEGERRAAANLPLLLSAGQAANAMEEEGAVLSPGLVQASSSPTMNWLIGGFYPESERQYANMAIDWANTFGFIRSGVTVRADEFPRYLSNFFGLESDGPQVLLEKQKRRQVFEQAAQIAAGRSKGEAGIVIGEAIKNGTIPKTIVNDFPFDPEVNQGIATALGLVQ